MKATVFSLLITISLLISSVATGSEAYSMTNNQTLNQKQESIILIAAFTADSDMDRLKPALNQGLDAGLTVNDIKEVLVHHYAYPNKRSAFANSLFLNLLSIE